MSADFLNEALAYAARGLSIIPIRHKPGTSGKQPALPGWKEFQTRRPTKPRLREWFGNGQKLNGLAVILGDASGGLVCRDFDELAAYERWAVAYPQLAATLPTVETARGRHVYFRSTWQGYIELNDGELRGDPGHYCLLPPSIHPNGTFYRWLVLLPEGELPMIDPFTSGLAGDEHCYRETEETEETKIKSNKRTRKKAASHSPTKTLEAQIERAIKATLPKKEGERNRLVFELARALKAIPALAEAPFDVLRPIVRKWHARALSVIGTKPFESTWAEFVAGWPQVKFPLGSDPFALILKRAEANPLPEALAGRFEESETRKLIGICRELQRSTGDGPFFLSCRKASELIGLDPMTTGRRFKMLEGDKVLRVVQLGDYRTRQATRFRYIAEEMS